MNCSSCIMRPKVDSHLSWIQAISSFIYHAVFFGVSFSFGVFYVELLDEFPGRESEAAWINSINFAFVMILSPLSVRILDCIPVQIVTFFGSLLGGTGLYLSSIATDLGTLYITYSVMYGIAIHLCYFSAVWIVRRNFLKKRDVAFGMASAGGGAGGVLVGLLLPILIQMYGWRGSMKVLSYITFAMVIFSFVMIPAKVERQVDEEKTKNSCLPCKCSCTVNLNDYFGPLKNYAFLVLSMAIMICTFVSLIPYTHIVNYAVQRGVSRQYGDRLPLFISAGSLIGRFSLGRLVGVCGFSRIQLGQLIFLFQSVVTTFLTIANTMQSLVAFSLLFGIFDGAFICLIAIVNDDVFEDTNKVMHAMGHLFWMLAFPYTFGAPFSAWLYKQTGSYEVPFFICGGILFFAAVLMSLVAYLLEKKDISTTNNFTDKAVVLSNDGAEISTLHSLSGQLVHATSCTWSNFNEEIGQTYSNAGCQISDVAQS